MAKTTKKASIAWWNTHLTPPKGSALSGDEYSFVVNEILVLLNKCDVVFLGEVSSKNLAHLSGLLAGTPYVVKDMTRSSGNRKFNLGLIYNNGIATFHRNEFYVKKIGGDNFKISCRMDFFVQNADYFSFLVCHWPSQLLKPGDAETRGHYGTALRNEIESLLNRGVKYLIVLGDFNDEPFNHSMTTFLRGCRDAGFVRSNPELLYNPFWKQIVCQKGYVRSPEESDRTGTYFHRSDRLHRWRVFDQMLFCASFVGQSDWHLNENGTGVLRHSRLVEAVESARFKLDHLPIVAELSKDVDDG